MACDEPKETLHVRVTISKRSLETAKIVAEELGKLGFVKIITGPRGVDLDAGKDEIEQRLNTVIGENEQGHLFLSEPIFPEEIKSLVRSAYFPRKPKSFN